MRVQATAATGITEAVAEKMSASVTVTPTMLRSPYSIAPAP